jgi:hypothetical protein
MPRLAWIFQLEGLIAPYATRSDDGTIDWGEPDHGHVSLMRVLLRGDGRIIVSTDLASRADQPVLHAWLEKYRIPVCLITIIDDGRSHLQKAEDWFKETRPDDPDRIVGVFEKGAAPRNL